MNFTQVAVAGVVVGLALTFGTVATASAAEDTSSETCNRSNHLGPNGSPSKWMAYTYKQPYTLDPCYKTTNVSITASSGLVFSNSGVNYAQVNINSTCRYSKHWFTGLPVTTLYCP